MSRSYRKVPPRKCSDYTNKRDIRIRDRASIHREMTNPEYGDAVFLSEKKLSSPWRGFTRYRGKKEIRDGYFLEIRNILNGYSTRLGASLEEDFIEIFRSIRNNPAGNALAYLFEWLNPKKAREAIKSWQGEPLDVLGYLASHGYIEKAVRQQFKKETAK